MRKFREGEEVTLNKKIKVIIHENSRIVFEPGAKGIIERIVTDQYQATIITVMFWVQKNIAISVDAKPEQLV